ncbi:hypothetical protein Tco_1185986 [Tanacetum coccineum]
MALLAQSFRATLPQTNNQLRTSSNTRNQATIQDGRVVVQNELDYCKEVLAKASTEFLFQGQDVADASPREWCNVDDEPTAQSIFMANLSSAGSANPQAGPSNASILSEVPYGNSNVIPYEQYLSVNDISDVPSCASSALNSVAIYEQRAKFELTEREQRMDDQMRMLIQNRNKTEENLKKELHSFKLQLKPKRPTGTLYDGDELLKPHHVPVTVSTSEEELELAEATRNKLHVKMNDSVCVEKRVNITPPNYSKENFMATFTPQTQLTPEQVFWSLDLAKRKAEELKANATPLPVLPPATVYPPNTPAHLVPRTLPTTSQVNIGLYVITQLFWDFGEKLVKTNPQPTGITEGKGF